MTMSILGKRRKAVSIFLLITFLFQLFMPLGTYALTSGPSQPEMQSFEPVGTTDMVDLFTGDFNYNIPLLDVEGYPINISYHSGISMDQEASWVGLGWNINPGVINRNMRGLPDDFKGDEIKQRLDTKPHKTWGVNSGFALELFGKEMKKKAKSKSTDTKSKIPNSFNLGFSIGIKNDNYRGMGFSFGLSPSYTISNGFSENSFSEMNGGTTGSKTTNKAGTSNDVTDRKISLDLNFDSQNGFEGDPSYSKTVRSSNSKQDACEAETHSKSSTQSVSMGFNSRVGFTGLTLSTSKSNRDAHEADGKVDRKSVSSSSNGGTFLTQNHPSYQPSARNKVNNIAISANFKMGLEMIAA